MSSSRVFPLHPLFYTLSEESIEYNNLIARKDSPALTTTFPFILFIEIMTTARLGFDVAPRVST